MRINIRPITKSSRTRTPISYSMHQPQLTWETLPTIRTQPVVMVHQLPPLHLRSITRCRMRQLPLHELRYGLREIVSKRLPVPPITAKRIKLRFPTQDMVQQLLLRAPRPPKATRTAQKQLGMSKLIQGILNPIDLVSSTQLWSSARLKTILTSTLIGTTTRRNIFAVTPDVLRRLPGKLTVIAT